MEICCDLFGFHKKNKNKTELSFLLCTSTQELCVEDRETDWLKIKAASYFTDGIRRNIVKDKKDFKSMRPMHLKKKKAQPLIKLFALHFSPL